MISNKTIITTADLCDQFPDQVRVLQPFFHCYGGIRHCAGEVVTIRLKSGNSALKELLMTEGNGRIIIVDVEADYVAVVGDQLASLAINNNWQAVIVHGFVRDTRQLSGMNVGIWALGACPKRGSGNELSSNNPSISIAGIDIHPGDYVCADEDGIVLLDESV